MKKCPTCVDHRTETRTEAEYADDGSGGLVWYGDREVAYTVDEPVRYDDEQLYCDRCKKELVADPPPAAVAQASLSRESPISVANEFKPPQGNSSQSPRPDLSSATYGSYQSTTSAKVGEKRTSRFAITVVIALFAGIVFWGSGALRQIEVPLTNTNSGAAPGGAQSLPPESSGTPPVQPSESESVATIHALGAMDYPSTPASIELVNAMATDVKEVRDCLQHLSAAEVLQVMDKRLLSLSPGKTIIRVSGTGKPECTLFGARMPYEWVYEQTLDAYIQLLDAGPVDALTFLETSHLGYRDLQSVHTFAAGAEATFSIFHFDGQHYVDSGYRRTVRLVADTPQAVGAKPSFDCAKATTSIETMICGDGELAVLERRMADEYRAAIQANDGRTQEVKAEHLQWFVKYTRTCGEAQSETERRGCIAQFLTSRTEELSSLRLQ